MPRDDILSLHHTAEEIRALQKNILKLGDIVFDSKYLCSHFNRTTCHSVELCPLEKDEIERKRESFRAQGEIVPDSAEKIENITHHYAKRYEVPLLYAEAVLRRLGVQLPTRINR